MIDLVIFSDKTIQDALVLLDKNARGILFVVERKQLIGVLTDGDIRRALIKQISLSASVKEAMNTEFVSLPIDTDILDIRKSFDERLRIIPLCNDKGELVDVADAQRSHRIPLLEPTLSGRELEYVTNCIQTNWISSQGQYVVRFEEQFENMHPPMSALSVANGTVALHLALHALGIGSGHEVLVPDVTFAATINAVLHCGATPLLCEIDKDTWCIDVSEAEKLIGPKTKAIIPVHLYGQPCDMDAIAYLAEKYGLLVVEDCAEAVGSRWRDRLVGSFGDAATFSFFGNKTISTGEGGMILFSNRETYEHAKILRDHGMKPGKKYWHEEIGFNYRLTNIQAAIGVGQMERISEILSKKKDLAKLYTKRLGDVLGISMLPAKVDSTVHSNWLYTVLIDKNINRDRLIEELLHHGIECRPVFYSLHTMPPYKKFRTSGSLDKSRFFSRTGISLPTSVSLRLDEINYIVKIFEKRLNKLVN